MAPKAPLARRRTASQIRRESARALAGFIAQPAVAGATPLIRECLSRDHEWVAIEDLIGFSRPKRRRRLRADVAEIIALALCVGNAVEEARGLAKAIDRISRGKLEAADDLPPDVRVFWKPVPGDDATQLELKVLAKTLSAGAQEKRRELELDRGGRPALIAFDAITLLLAGAFERATGYPARVTRVPGAAEYAGAFVELVEVVLAIINCAPAPAFDQPVSSYSRGRKIERLTRN
jgi:hypothetical protein